MKRVLLMALVVVSIFAAQAQVCTPDMTITEPGVYPDQPDTAYADQPYSFNFEGLVYKNKTNEYCLAIKNSNKLAV